MARPLRIEYPGAFYHVTSRGNERKEIFKSQRDREKFLSYLESSTQRYDALIHVFCLMENHYHLFLETPSGNLSQIMRHINGAYTTYFNVKRQRSGHLFQGRYKAILVDVDEYAKELSRYIHLNPLRAGIVEKLEEYPWSSYPYYIGLEKAPAWLARNSILSYFADNVSDAQAGYSEFVEAMIGREYKSPLKETAFSTILGSTDFIKVIKEKYIKNKEIDPNIPALKVLSGKPSIEEIENEVGTIFGADEPMCRKVNLYFCHRYSGKKLKEIGKHFGIGASGVAQASRRIALKISNDAKLRKKVKLIESRLKLL